MFLLHAMLCLLIASYLSFLGHLNFALKLEMACTRSPASGPFITSKTNTFSNCSWPIEISGPLKEQKLQGLTGGPQFIQAFKSGRNNYVKKYVLALEQSVLNTSQNFDILDLLEIQSLLWTLLWSRNGCVFNLSTIG